jgi:AcrR family transcriptional regulator
MTRSANLPVSPVSAGRHGFPDVYVRYMQRTRIFDTACKVVTERGLLEASFDHIQQPTGVTKGRVYDLYQTRDNLVVDAMAHALTFAQMRVCAAFDRAPTPAEGLDAAIWTLLDVASAAPQWSRFALLEAIAVGPDAWERRDRALAPVRDRLKRLMPSDRPKDAPQWGVEAVLAALRPQLVGEAILKPTPRLHRDLVNLVRTMCGMPPTTEMVKRPARDRAKSKSKTGMVGRVTEAFFALNGDPAGIDALRAELDVAIERRHGPALSQAVRCLVARDDEHDKRLAGLRKPILEALPEGWIFGTPLRYPGPKPYSLNSSRLRVLEVVRETPGADEDAIRDAIRLTAQTCRRTLRDLDELQLLQHQRGDHWRVTVHGQALLEGDATLTA